MLAIYDIMRGASARRSMGRLKYLYRDAKWSDSIKFVHKYINDHVDEALNELRDRSQNPDKFLGKSERRDLLWTLVQQVHDRDVLREQLAALWLPSTESTSVLLSNVLFFLSRHSRVWERLQNEVQALGDQKLTFSKLRSMQYTNWVIDEGMYLVPQALLPESFETCRSDLYPSAASDAGERLDDS
jgi:cytochrome P450